MMNTYLLTYLRNLAMDFGIKRIHRSCVILNSFLSLRPCRERSAAERRRVQPRFVACWSRTVLADESCVSFQGG